MKHRRFSLVAGLAGILLLLAGAAQAEPPTLTLYNGQHKDATAALIQAFEAQSDIRVVARNGSSNELAHQVREEGARSPADLIYTEETTPLIMLAKAGLLATLDAQTLAAVPADYRDGAGHWVGVLARSRVVVFNPALIPEADLPASVLDLGDPEWHGKFAFVPTSGAFQAQLSATIKLKGEAAADRWLKGLKANGKVYRKNALVLDAVERGDIAFGLINNYYWDRLAREKGKANLASRLHFFGSGDMGDMLTVAGMAVLASSRHPEAAEEFIRFALSPAGQQILTDRSGQYPLNAATEAHPDLKPFAELRPPQGTLDLGEYGDGSAAVKLLQANGLL